jgi:hypothetical protein
MFRWTYLNFWFARSRLRRGPKVDPKLKDLTQLHHIRKKIKEYRTVFESSPITETFTNAIHSKKPKLKKRFKLDEAKLNKV